jgi:hypothetical protein
VRVRVGVRARVGVRVGVRVAADLLYLAEPHAQRADPVRQCVEEPPLAPRAQPAFGLVPVGPRAVRR